MKQEILITSLLLLKAEINKRELRFSRLKSNKSIQENRNAILELRSRFANLLYNNYDLLSLLVEKISDENKNAFTVMAPVGGPYYIRPEATLHAYKCMYGKIQVVFDSYVGFLSLLDDPCGCDNLRVLATHFYKVNAPEVIA